MCKESYEAIDEGSLPLGLIRLAIPIALSGMLQQLFNSVDVAVIGRFAGGLALAAVGANAANVSLFVMLLTGLSVGPNVLIALRDFVAGCPLDRGKRERRDFRIGSYRDPVLDPVWVGNHGGRSAPVRGADELDAYPRRDRRRCDSVFSYLSVGATIYCIV